MAKKKMTFDAFAAYMDKIDNEKHDKRFDKKMKSDGDWRKVYNIHASLLVRAFCDGLLQASPWQPDGYIPSRLEGMLKWISFMTAREYRSTDTIETSISEAVGQVRKWANEHPEFRQWKKRIDTDALFQNMASNLRLHVCVMAAKKSAIKKMKKG